MYELAGRYAAALAAVAEERGIMGRVEDDLRFIDDCFKGEPYIAGRLASPSIDGGDRCRILEKSFGDRLHEMTFRLLHLLVRRGRIMLIPYLYGVFRQIREKMEGHITVTVTSARALDSGAKQLAEKRVLDRYGVMADVTFAVDEKLMAGIRVAAGEQEIDASVHARLLQMKETLLQC